MSETSSILDRLARGVYGLVMTPPPGLEIETPGEVCTDRANGVAYIFSFRPGDWIDPRAAAAARVDRHIARRARALYDAAFDDTLPGAKRHPPDWSPVISIERETIAGIPALTILHRTSAQPTREEILGRTLITVADGLFEARWTATPDRITGVREARLLEEHFKRSSDLPTPAYFDDPIHDARFADLALSRARRAKSWHTRAQLAVTRPRTQFPGRTPRTPSAERCCDTRPRSSPR